MIRGPTGAMLTVGEALTITFAGEDCAEVTPKLSETVTVIE
jgi:hypothetical protein